MPERNRACSQWRAHVGIAVLVRRRLEIKALKKAAEKQKKAEVQAKKKTEALARVAAMSPEQLQAHSAARKINLEERRRQDQEKQARLRRVCPVSTAGCPACSRVLWRSPWPDVFWHTSWKFRAFLTFS